MRQTRFRQTYYMSSLRTGSLYSSVIGYDYSTYVTNEAAQKLRTHMERLQQRLAKIPGVTAADQYYCDDEDGHVINVYIDFENADEKAVLAKVCKTTNTYFDKHLQSM